MNKNKIKTIILKKAWADRLIGPPRWESQYIFSILANLRITSLFVFGSPCSAVRTFPNENALVKSNKWSRSSTKAALISWFPSRGSLAFQTIWKSDYIFKHNLSAASKSSLSIGISVNSRNSFLGWTPWRCFEAHNPSGHLFFRFFSFHMTRNLKILPALCHVSPHWKSSWLHSCWTFWPLSCGLRLILGHPIRPNFLENRWYKSFRLFLRFSIFFRWF